MEYKISTETAQAEIKKLLDWYMFEIEDVSDEKQRQGIQMSIEKLIKGVRAGLLEIKTETGLQVIQLLRNGQTVTYDEIGGEAKCAMDGIDPNKHYERMYALLAKLSGMPVTAIKQMKGIDNAIAESLGTLFLLCA